MKEADLYPPIKAYLEGQGYTVKAEIGACDIMARRGDEPALIVEMKTSFSLSLVMQGVARQGMFDDVYLAVPLGPKGWSARYKDIVALCRRLGLGLLAVRAGSVEATMGPHPPPPTESMKAPKKPNGARCVVTEFGGTVRKAFMMTTAPMIRV